MAKRAADDVDLDVDMGVDVDVNHKKGRYYDLQQDSYPHADLQQDIEQDTQEGDWCFFMGDFYQWHGGEWWRPVTY